MACSYELLQRSLASTLPIVKDGPILPLDVQHLLCTYLNLRLLLRLRTVSQYWFCLATGYLLEKHSLSRGVPQLARAYPRRIKQCTLWGDTVREDLWNIAGAEKVELIICNNLTDDDLWALSGCSAVVISACSGFSVRGLAAIENVSTIDVEGFTVEALQYFGRATTVTLTHMTLEGNVFAALASVQHLSTRLCEFSKKNAVVFPPQLRSLHIYFCSSERDIPGRLLHGLCNLTSLHTGGSVCLTDDDLAYLPGLKVAHLEGSLVTSNGLKHLHRLRELSLGRFSLLDWDFSALAGVETLRMNFARLSHGSLRHLLNLRSLSVSNTDIEDTDLAVLRASMQRPLHDINLAFCANVTDAGMRHIAGVRQANLFRCKVGDTGLQALCGIHTILLPDKVTDAGLRWLTGAVHVDLSYCCHVTDSGLQWLRGASFVRLPLTVKGLTSSALSILSDCDLAHPSSVKELRCLME